MIHPSEETLERYAVAELVGNEAIAVRTHVEACAACQATIAALDVERAQLLTRQPPAALIAALERRRFSERRRSFRRVASVGGTLMAMAAALLIWVRPHGSYLGIKGGGLSVYVKHADAVRFLGADDRVNGGDALRFVVTLDRHELVRAWSIDDNGRVDALMPAPAEVGPGAVELAGSVLVETPCVSAWVVVAVGDAARLTPGAALDAQNRTATLGQLSAGGFHQRLTCELH
jgi:hypothetical protein